jgi:teichuronic acid biosynthesis glycosyltransferase TuaG
MSKPLISVVTGTFNQERYLPEALDSVFAQTYPHYEVIVVDDASTDRTVEIVQRYGKKIRLFRRTQNSGVCQITRNEGIHQAQGEYVAFLDHDDAWYPEKLEKQVAFMEANREILFSHTYCDVMDENSRVTGVRHEANLPATGPCFSALLRHCFITISTVMVRRRLFEDIGLFNEDRALLSEDYEFFLRVAKRFPVGLLPDVLSRYRKSRAGITSRNWRYQPEAVPFYERVLRTPALWEGAAPRSEVVGVLVSACLENGVYWRDHREPGRAAYFALRALRRDPANTRAWTDLAKGLLKPLVRRS